MSRIAIFDNISHGFILKSLGTLPGRELMKQWLKAGYVESEIFHATERGVPQGGVISPLAANIALDGLEKRLGRKYSYIRYADDFIVTAKSREDIEAVLPMVTNFFIERGLQLNMEKTRIVHVKDGLNFLGFHVRSYNNKCIVKPQKERVLALLKEIRDWLKNNPHATPAAVIGYLNPILRGWANYNKRVNSKNAFSWIDHEVWRALWRWCRNRHKHKRKSSTWIKPKYFRRVDGRDWTFFARYTDSNGGHKEVHLLRISSIPVVRHVKISGTNSPDDPRLREYWFQRTRRFRCTREQLLGALDAEGLS